MKLNIDQKAPVLEVELQGGGEFKLYNRKIQNFALVIFYRGIHCPVCKKYLESLNRLISEYQELGVNEVIAISGDSIEKAEETRKEWDIDGLALGFNISENTMREWGLHLSESIKESEPAIFNEPGMFLVDKDFKIFYSAINSMPFGRPDLKDFLESVKFIVNEKYPARGNYHDFKSRKNSNEVDELFISRWSPRAFEKDSTLSEEELRKVIGAARWAPSCFNEQPWEFQLATREGSEFDNYISLLVESNQEWAQNAFAIGFIIGRKQFRKNGKDNKTFQFDCGAAWMSLSLQANLLGLRTHGMGGIKRDEIMKKFSLDHERYEVICGFTLGREAGKEILSEELKSKEELTQRNNLDDFFHLC